MAYKKLKYWIDLELAESLANKLKRMDADFDESIFLTGLAQALEPLEYKARLAVFADRLNASLNGSYPQKVKSFVKILGSENPNETGTFKEYYWINPIASFVEFYGLDHLKPSLRLMTEITKRSTAEFAIRPFILKYPDELQRCMLRLAKSPNFHLRRLASEGMRINLPWAKKFHQFVEDPSDILVILELLKDDPSRYVQKSVANNLNDLLKVNPGAAWKVLERWMKGSVGVERRWIIKHALRNLLKEGDSRAVAVLREIQES